MFLTNPCIGTVPLPLYFGETARYWEGDPSLGFERLLWKWKLTVTRAIGLIGVCMVGEGLAATWGWWDACEILACLSSFHTNRLSHDHSKQQGRRQQRDDKGQNFYKLNLVILIFNICSEASSYLYLNDKNRKDVLYWEESMLWLSSGLSEALR